MLHCSYSFLDDDNIIACVLPKGVSAENAPKRPPLGPQGPRISVRACASVCARACVCDAPKCLA